VGSLLAFSKPTSPIAGSALVVGYGINNDLSRFFHVDQAVRKAASQLVLAGWTSTNDCSDLGVFGNRRGCPIDLVLKLQW
jgi:hypothetical protein